MEISERFTEEWADLSPSDATQAGIPGRDDSNTDFSPDGYAARNDLYERTREELRRSPGSSSRDSFAAKVLLGWLDEEIAEFRDDKWCRDLNHSFSPFQRLRDTFDVMPRNTPEDLAIISERLAGLPAALSGYQQTLGVGLASKSVVARRQVESIIQQSAETASDDSRFIELVAQAAAVGADTTTVERAVDVARMGFGSFAGWLRGDYLPAAADSDAVGEERYVAEADRFLGMAIDPLETYNWGWSEVHRIREEMVATAAEIDPSLSVYEVIDLLNTDPTRSAATREDFVEFISRVQEQAVAQLSGEHFDVPDEIKTVSVNMAPPGGSLGAWYVGPNEDFSRAGSIWYAPGERERLPYWDEVSTAYHEGFPGHHLQVGTAVLQKENLSRFQRTVIWYSGAGEGWALYAERLMDELGYFEKPEYRLGLLSSQLFRSVRVVLDIGCQLELAIPDNAPLYPGDIWDYQHGVDYMTKVARQPLDMSESEVTRYLGWYGQAISYKVGEREILDIRDKARTDAGSSFDRKDFHRRVLEAGAIRFDHLREELF